MNNSPVTSPCRKNTNHRSEEQLPRENPAPHLHFLSASSRGSPGDEPGGWRLSRSSLQSRGQGVAAPPSHLNNTQVPSTSCAAPEFQRQEHKNHLNQEYKSPSSADKKELWHFLFSAAFQDNQFPVQTQICISFFKKFSDLSLSNLQLTLGHLT